MRGLSEAGDKFEHGEFSLIVTLGVAPLGLCCDGIRFLYTSRTSGAEEFQIISVNLRKKLQDFLLLEGFPTPIYTLFDSKWGEKPLQQEERDAKLTLMGC